MRCAGRVLPSPCGEVPASPGAVAHPPQKGLVEVQKVVAWCFVSLGGVWGQCWKLVGSVFDGRCFHRIPRNDVAFRGIGLDPPAPPEICEIL